jgi:hypothetical protein
MGTNYKLYLQKYHEFLCQTVCMCVCPPSKSLYKMFKECIGSICQKSEAIIHEVRRRLLNLYNTCKVVNFLEQCLVIRV